MFFLMNVFCELTTATVTPAPRGQGRLIAEPLARFAAKEQLGIDWQPTLVSYAVSFRAGQAHPGQLRLVSADGQEHAFQLSRVKLHLDGSIAAARVSFMTELKKGESYNYALIAGTPTATDSPCKASAEENYLTLDNGIVALRLPKPGRYKFEPPLHFGESHLEMVRLYGKQIENDIAPKRGSATALSTGPIQGLRLADGRWVGGSYFYAEEPDRAPKVTGYICQVTEQGPLFVEARVRYTFDNGGFYRLTARLLANDPAARIDEQFDMGTTGGAFMWRVVISLSKGWEDGGWKPDSAYWYSASPPPANIPGRDGDLEMRLSAVDFDVRSYQDQTFGSGKLHYDEPFRKVFDIAVWYPWNKNAHYFGLLDSRTLEPSSAQRDGLPFVGVIPMHAGNWRSASGAQNGMLFIYQADDVALHWPLVARPHPNTLLDTGEYDPNLPFTFGRRQWALVAGPLQYHETMHSFRKYEGYVNLDDYKDWALEWQADPRLTYPRLVFSKRKFLSVEADDRRREELWQTFTSREEPTFWRGGTRSGPLGQVISNLTGQSCLDRLEWVSSYHQTTMADWVVDMDELLSNPKLTEKQRRQLRAHLAALCYLLTEPDFNPRGSMIHLGNPNMPMNRFFALAFAAALIPNHPMAEEWLDVAAKYLRYKLAMNVGPNGVWSELISYFHASAPFLIQAATALGQTSRLDDATARLATLPARFTIQLLSPPDPRFGTRMQVGWGHEGYFIFTHWLVAAGLIRERDSNLAKALVWSWDQLGRPTQHSHDQGFSERLILNADLLDDLEADYVPDELRSVWLPGFGVVMRAHAGDPNETSLQYRQGYLTSHSDANQGDFVLYAKGAPLTTFSLFGYAIYDVEDVPSPFGKLYKTFGWHNRVRFGSQDNFGGWPGGGLISQVHAHFFSDSGDYLRGLGDHGPQRWTRQILFLKGKAATGPNYFVFRDSFHNLDGQPYKLEQKWWYLRTLGSKNLVAVSEHELNYTSPYGPKLNVHFLMPATIQAQRKDATHNGPLWYQAGMNWRKAGSPIAQDGRDFGPHSISVNETMTVSAVGPVPPGQDILTVLYPQGAGEALPQYELLADGVARITTSESADYVFVHREPMTFAKGDVSFEGIAGMVRVYPDEVHLVIAEGPGVISYKGVVLRSPVPVAKVIPIAQVGKPKIIGIPRPQETIQFSLEHQAEFKAVTPGVKRADFPGGFAYAFESTELIRFEAEGIVFVGSRGGIVVHFDTGFDTPSATQPTATQYKDEEKKTVRLVLVRGERIGYQRLQAWGCNGPYEVTFHHARIAGRTNGLGRFLYLSTPEGLNRLPMLVLDGQTYAPGTSDDTLIVPIMPGEHQFEIRALEQPPIWRNWQAWDNQQ